MTDDVIARATAALEGVTEGPWRASLLDGIDYEDGSSCIRGGVYPDVHGSAPVFLSSSGIDRRDARFIAAARTLVPELLAEVERLRGALDRVVQLWKAQTLTLIHGEYRAALDDHIKVIEAVLRGDQ
ncbi:hypothetical protein [Mycolicibacter kumamotonensis]|uniref:hypothetical protein n=1 Tax=Mycolicibacter kumamotonensis TaxID=354243 RepID=UPI0008064E92|nr:hypothetical protein [Mycolicibacter kumamotonensis]